MHLRITISVVLLLLSSQCWSMGNLVIIGGGSRPPEMIRLMAGLAGGEDANLIIIPTASSEPEDVATYQAAQFTEYGCGAVSYILPTVETADSESLAAIVRNASGVFFSGGDQRRLTQVLLGSAVLEEIRALYERGGLVAGTSAGAAVMSDTMITGDERKYPESDDSFSTIEADNIITTPGFGFISGVVIDQHFVARKRYNRMISLMLEHPELRGIGIDESTAIWVKPDSTLEVVGESCVVFFDPTSARIEVRDDQTLGVDNLMLDVLLPGERVDLRTWEVIQ